MSLIADALKTAQREKQMRESGGVRASLSPVLVPLRPSAAGTFAWPRTIILAAAGATIVAATVIGVQRMRKARPLAPLPPMASSLLDDLRETPAPPMPGRHATLPKADLSPVDRARPTRASLPARRIGAVGTPLRTKSPVLQGQALAAIPQDATPATASGRLRIALEQPDASDSGRLFAEALAAHRAGNLVAARALYERVLGVSPDHADALNNLGVLLSGEREFDRALMLLRRAASVAPTNAGIWNNIGTALREQGHGSDAVAAFQHALSIDPSHQGARVGLAQQYLVSRSLPQARRLLEEVLVVNPVLPEAHYALAQVFELQGDRAAAIRSYLAFVRVAPPRLAAAAERVRLHVDSLARTP